MSTVNTQYPTEIIDLPSKGWFYPDGHPFKNGTAELYFMSARHEDILTSTNLIRKNLVIDRLFEELIATPALDYKSILAADKSGILVAARIMGYGKDYKATVTCPSCQEIITSTFNLEEFESKELDESLKNKTTFEFTLPMSKHVVTFRFLTHGDEIDLRNEEEMFKKSVGVEQDKKVTSRLSKMITSINSVTSPAALRQMIDGMHIKDSRALREYALKISPGVNLISTFNCNNCNYSGDMEVPLDISFFWPDIRE